MRNGDRSYKVIYRRGRNRRGTAYFQATSKQRVRHRAESFLSGMAILSVEDDKRPEAGRRG